MCASRVLLAPFFPSVAPGNLAKPSLHALPSRGRAAQLPASQGWQLEAAPSGRLANGIAVPGKQVCLWYLPPVLYKGPVQQKCVTAD